MAKILVIEDEQGIREGIGEILFFEGYQVIEAENGAAGVQLAKEETPDLILCDIMMPAMDGFEVLEALREEGSFVQTPFLFLTALGDRANIRSGMNLGADDYIVKPFSKDELLDAVTSKLNKYQKIIGTFEQKIKEVETILSEELGSVKEENLKLSQQIEGKDEELVAESLRAIDTSNVLKQIRTDIEKLLMNRGLNESERRNLVSLRNSLKQKPLLSNSWMIFQIKFNQVYPDFIKKLTALHKSLTEYEVLLASTIVSGLNNNQVADLLSVTPESARKSRYRLKRKLGLQKEDDLKGYITSII